MINLDTVDTWVIRLKMKVDEELLLIKGDKVNLNYHEGDFSIEFVGILVDIVYHHDGVYYVFEAGSHSE